MSKKIDIKEASRSVWEVTVSDEVVYPGDGNIKLGCLMRIADATEAMSKNYVNLLNEIKYKKDRIAGLEKTVSFLIRSNSALRGHLKRHKSSINK